MQSRKKLHLTVNKLNDEQVDQLMVIAERMLNTPSDPVWRHLQDVSGIEIPDQWPPRFGAVGRIWAEGELASEQLVRERR